MPHIKANGINTYYEYEGKGPPLVIIGGFASDHYLLKDFIKPLKKLFKVLIMDLRGFGDTEITNPPYSIDLLAEDILGLMNSLNIKNAYMLGHSMGSAILQTICLKYPQKVKKAILSATFLKIPYTTQIIFELIPKLFEKNIDQKIISKIVMSWIHSSDFLKNPDNFNHVLQSMSKREINPVGYEGQSVALKNFDSTSWISKIDTETLILAGKEDLDTPLYCAEMVHKKLKKSKLKIIENAAHMMYKEKPDEFNKAILSFFK